MDHGVNCASDDYSSKCYYPFNYYVWVASDDYLNLNEFSRYTDEEPYYIYDTMIKITNMMINNCGETYISFPSVANI